MEPRTIPTRNIGFSSLGPVNSQLTIYAHGEPSIGGAQPNYEIHGGGVRVISFQNGTVPEVGINGVTVEALIAICVDQLKSFQSGPFSCRENAVAITKLEEAQMWLEKRMRDRVARGVEGTYQK
jgi:hypothetical protein